MSYYTFEGRCVKVCSDIHCEIIWHNCPQDATRCKECGARVMKIDEGTYHREYRNKFFQLNWETGEGFVPRRWMNSGRLF